MRGTRRFSQAIAEGDGISVIVDVSDAEAVRAAEREGAEAVLVRGPLAGVREATELPILWSAPGPLTDAATAGADACLVVLEHHAYDGERLEELQAEATELGLDCVIEVRSEEELKLALGRLDPDIFLLRAADPDGDGVLDLLPDVPAGKLAIAQGPMSSREYVEELERAGIDAVIVGARDVAGIVGDAPPPV